MRLALIGIDDDALALVRWAVQQGGHALVAAFDVGPRAAEVQAIAPHIQPSEDWESLVLGSAVDAVVVGRGGAGLTQATGIPDDERRADQLRKLAQAAVPMLVVCPACEAIVGFEIEMIARDTRSVIVPFIPNSDHPAVRKLAELVAWGDASPLGRIEQVVLEREQTDRSRRAVLTQLAQDAALLRQLVGPIHGVSASGPAATAGRDPLGPKPKEPPALSNLSVHVSGQEGLAARWSIGPALEGEQGTISLIGTHGKAMLKMPAAGHWTLSPAGGNQTQQTFSPDHDAAQVFSRLTHAMSGLAEEPEAWLNACRDQEVAEAVDRSLARGRTIELFNEEHTEEESFKGVMAMGGCLLLVMAMGVVFLATIVEGLRLPMRDWPLWQYWPIYLLVPIAAFLLLQLLQLAIKRDEGSLQHMVTGEKPAN
jgi:hypothetical protein